MSSVVRAEGKGYPDMIKRYRIGFEIRGLALFLFLMIPNFIWFVYPAPNDILRTESVTVAADTIASICQVLMIAALCVLINRERNPADASRLRAVVAVLCLLYDICWIFYYAGVTNGLVIMGLILFPCLAFLFFAIDRKNMAAIVPIIIFTVCHLIYGIVNFIL